MTKVYTGIIFMFKVTYCMLELNLMSPDFWERIDISLQGKKRELVDFPRKIFPKVSDLSLSSSNMILALFGT